ncbi:MAG: transcriptional regulator [Candidatus Woesearchaeota archaeon]
MKNKLLMPQEIEVHYLIPSINRIISKELTNLNIPQKRIAELLHSQNSAISQYINDKRGIKIKFDKEIEDYIKKRSNIILENNNYIFEIQNILSKFRKEKILCKYHRELSPIINLTCSEKNLGCNIHG